MPRAFAIDIPYEAPLRCQLNTERFSQNVNPIEK
jgi:hypothetical protein